MQVFYIIKKKNQNQNMVDKWEWKLFDFKKRQTTSFSYYATGIFLYQYLTE